MMKNSSKKSGFTLVELMVVIVIIAILAGVVMMNYDKVEEGVYEPIIKHDFNTISSAITRFKLDTGHYPDSLAELIFGEEIERWKGPYFDNPPLDPWKRPYLYEYTGDSPKPYILKTLGADGEEGGDEKGKTENRDYCNLDIYKEYASTQ
jgi:general secretion pathway protein G